MDSSIEPSELEGQGPKAGGFKFKRGTNLKELEKNARDDFYSQKAESMVRYSKRKTGKYFNMTK